MNPKIDSHSSPQPLPCPEPHSLAQPQAEAQLQPQLETRPESRPEAQTAASQQANPENYVRKKNQAGTHHWPGCGTRSDAHHFRYFRLSIGSPPGVADSRLLDGLDSL